MDFAAAILVVLLKQPVHYTDKGEEGRVERLTTVARSVATASESVVTRKFWPSKETMAGALIELGRIESTFAYNVHSGRCRPFECDVSLKGFTAVGIWQTHKRKKWTLEFWESMKGVELEPTSITATVTAEAIAGGVGMCGSLAGSFSLYNTGSTCSKAYAFESAERAARRFAQWIVNLEVRK
jgi:hypothetical protein